MPYLYIREMLIDFSLLCNKCLKYNFQLYREVGQAKYFIIITLFKVGSLVKYSHLMENVVKAMI